MPATQAFTEADLQRARKEVRDLEQAEADERAAADKLVADMRESGTDPLADGEAFAKVDEAYKAPDAKADQLVEARQRRDRIAEIVGIPGGGQPSGNGNGDGGSPAPMPAGGDGASLISSWGDKVVTSDAYKRLLDSGQLRQSQAQINLDPVEVASRDELEQSGLFQAQVIGNHGPLVPSDRRLMPPLLAPQREIMVIDLLNVGTTDSDQVEYTEETSRTPAAGGAAFGTAFNEFNVTWAVRTVNVRRRGAMHTATRGNLADQGQLRTILDTLLDEDVRLEAEDQVVGGDGTGENFTGIYNTAGIGSVTRQTGEAYTDALHRGITVIRLARRRDPSALLIHPNNHEEVVLDKDANGAYRLGSAGETDRRTIWGLGAVPSEAATEDLPLWGRFADASLWLREGLTVSAFNQHEDYAARGLVLLVAEHRAAFRVLRAPGFATVDFTP